MGMSDVSVMGACPKRIERRPAEPVRIVLNFARDVNELRFARQDWSA